VRRHGDIPGADIPQVYFDYVRSGDARVMARVFEHNRLDILSLAALAALACQWVDEGRAEDPRDVLSLARVLERARHDERAIAAYRRALAAEDAGHVRQASRHGLATQLKRRGEHASAAELWEQAAACGDLAAVRELAMWLEHRRRDHARALTVVEDALRCPDTAETAHLRRDLEHRAARLRRKVRG
jgi:hypothetical protein